MRTEPVLVEMEKQLSRWETKSDRRAIFLSCYRLMTLNMLQGIQNGEFYFQHWVNRLLNRFSEFYFDALRAYEADLISTPRVWRIVFDASQNPKTSTLQNLLLGVNAHINFDLPLTLQELLEPDWFKLDEGQKRDRYIDHCHVNEIIARTINVVQDEVIEKWSPGMDFVDRIFGPLDEWLISQLITHWREEVWKNAVKLVETPDEISMTDLKFDIEKTAVQRAQAILLTKSILQLQDLL